MKSNLPIALTALATLGLTAASLHADTFGSGGNAFSIDFVTVGDPGNADDSGTTGSYYSSYGGVSYTFRMGTYEVSRDIIAKANAGGNLGITLADMTAFGGNVATDPATGVSWNEAARFVNWLNTSQGYSAAYKFALQPGDVGYSSNANLLLWDSGDAGYDANNLYRNSNAYYFLPSEDEWYKAAYYSGSGTTYYDYATGSDTTPTAVASGTVADSAVYNQVFSVGPADTDNAGDLSYYGTMGQNGNVQELIESALAAPNDSPTENRVIRGGYWNGAEANLRSSTRISAPTTNESANVGFRIASVVPEPSIGILGLLGSTCLLLKRRRIAE
ncbi:MAG: SUMF1/EgtB/PvdO family nonheme iron enzyme [Akkermansiaceae bacterium]|nr:SUMF1/EgtB/PvdO family nonheme iron enzyme [Akkermansiaceae bacterium]MCP5545563.1 SUMF1/EgtB/PvdO family nonheme iron enzyme [Akkermansiaceae bacterium]MCP5548031.1 SUMF1/EgtB/PvdO family nonheme iron enzyme [Akkermansiaceae bacterium]